MTFTPPHEVRWNIFARELEDVLQAHNLWIGKLDDIGVIYYPEKVRRLKQSLRAPTQFPTLNPEELERLEAMVPLTADERARLRAALAATAVERSLMDREDPATALMAADDVFHVLLARLRVQPESPLASVRGEVGFVVDEDADDRYAAVFDHIDRGTLALHAAHGAVVHARVSNAERAQGDFRRALRLLAGIKPAAADQSEWIAGREEATHGAAAAGALSGDEPARGDE